MTKTIQLQIAKPCHENWNEMTANEQGAFCKSCQKNVIDFTRKTQNETYDIVTSTDGEICGRFFTEQLEQPILKTEINSSFFNWKAIAASLAAFVSAERIAANDVAQNPKSASTVKKPDNQNCMLKGKVVQSQQMIKGDVAIIHKPDSVQTFTIKGRVLDADSKKPIESATITLGNNAEQVIYSDKHGNFLITYKGKPEDKITIGRSYDHETKLFTLSELKQLQSKSGKAKMAEIKLKYHRQMMMGMVMRKD